MSGQRTEVNELPEGWGGESDRCARPLADDMLGGNLLIGKNDVMLGAFAVDQGDLHRIALVRSQVGIDHAVDVSPEANEHHPSLGDSGSQGITHVGGISRLGTASRWLRVRRRRLRLGRRC